MPIGSTVVYNAGDLILSTVSSSGNTFQENKIAAATSSIILFNSNGLISSQSLVATTVGTASYFSGSTAIIANLTASNISSSGNARFNTLTASSLIATNGPLIVTGSNAYLQLFPVGGSPIPSSTTASYIYTSGSTNDLYFTQYSGPYTNTTRLRWLESNLYTGILYGGTLTSTPGSTTFNVTSGSGIIVSMNATTGSDPYPVIKQISWPTYTNQPIQYSGSAKITYVGLDNNGQIVQQTNAWGSSDINQWDTQINLGVVLHLSGSVSTGVFNSPQISYGYPQKTDDFFRAFGPLKISGHTLQASGSGLSIQKTGGVSYREGANYNINPNHPSTVTENAITSSKIYRYYMSGSTPIIDTGVSNAGYTTLDITKYNNNGTLTSLNGSFNNQFTLQRVFWVPNSPTNAFIVYYGNAVYTTLLDAVNAVNTEAFTEAPNTSLNAIQVATIVIEGDSTNLTTANKCTIVQAGLFRNTNGIGSGGSGTITTALDTLSDVAISGVSQGDLLIYGNGTQWINSKTLSGSYVLTGSLTTNDGVVAVTVTASAFSGSLTGSLFGTSSWATNSLTASSLITTNNYTIANLTASNISASGTGSFNIIGIGTTNPRAILDVSYGDYQNAGAIRIGADIGTNRTRTDNSRKYSTITAFPYNNNSASVQIIALDAISSTITGLTIGGGSDALASPTRIQFYTTSSTTAPGAERMRIDSSGNVGIGTTVPVNKLDVAGNISCSVITASNFFGTSSWATNALTAAALVSANSYNITNLTASNINTSGTLSLGSVSGFHNIYLQKPLVVDTNYQRLHFGTRWYWDFTANTWTSSVQPNVDNPDWTAIDSLATYLSFKVGSTTGSITSLTTSSYNENERLRLTATGAILSTSGSDTELRIVNNDPSNDPKLTFYSGSTALWAVGADDSDDDKFKINRGSLLATSNALTINTASYVGIGTSDPRATLHVVGNVSASSFTGSFSGSITTATTATTASYLVPANNYAITDLTASGKIIYRSAVLLDYSSSNMPTTISVVLQNLTGSYNAAFFDYAIFSGSNSRAGTIVSTWNGGSIVYNETCTTDIGNTNLITMSVGLSSGYVQLGVSGSGVTNWNIKASARYI